MSAQAIRPPLYHPLSRYYRRRFGCKVYKVSVSVAQSCPNREGLRGMTACTFCDAWGSAAYADTAGLPLAEQVAINGERIRRRYKADKLLVYLQAYTNTFARVSLLEAWCEEALALPGVAGLVIGTRPDCLPPGMVRRLGELARRNYVSVELGVQTLDDGQLAFLARGHDRDCSLRALERLAAYPELDVCAHLMFGLPGETDAQLAETAGELSRRGVRGVKLHNLHVLRNTPLERMYRAGDFRPIGLADYAERVRVFLEHLHPEVAVHRLNAVASRWDEVVAPDWAREKLRPTQAILDHLARHGSWQGKHDRVQSMPEGAVPEGAMAKRTVPAGSTLGPHREWERPWA
jgi:radical SAM protein (TIGR01212 family)